MRKLSDVAERKWYFFNFSVAPATFNAPMTIQRSQTAPSAT